MKWYQNNSVVYAIRTVIRIENISIRCELIRLKKERRLFLIGPKERYDTTFLIY